MFSCLQKSCASFLAILVICSLPLIRVKAQETQLQRTPGALVMGSSLTFAAAFPVVKNEPYTADVLMQDIRSSPDGKRSVHEAFNVHMRDFAGRLRDEQLASPPDPQGGFVQASVHVLDPVAMQDFQWNKDTKTVFTGAIPASFSNYRQSPIIKCAQRIAASHADGLTHNPSQSQEIYEDLGERMIEGINAHGCRITRTAPMKGVTNESGVSTTEIWASHELQINLLTTEHNSDGTERLTKLSNIHRNEPDPTLFHVPEGYTDPVNAQRSAINNANPNYQAIREYGRIEWHGDSARLVASSSRPLDMVASTLSSCLGVAVNAEDPQYRFVGDLLDVTAPQWAAQHPDRHVYAAKPAKVEITFDVSENGSPRDLHALLQNAVQQVNQLQSNIYAYELRESVHVKSSFYTFVPTSSRNETGVLEHVPAYLDQRITIAEQTAPVASFASSMTRALSEATGLHFSCCQAMVIGQPWGMRSITYHATDQIARTVIEDLVGYVGGEQSYILRCQPMDKRFCFISVLRDTIRKPPTAPQSGVCSALGYDGY
jgi:hypothetical protein